MSDNNPDDDNNNNIPRQEEEDDNWAYLPADHHLYTKFQNALTKQLTDEHERVDLELIESEANLKAIEKEKEDIGIRLYSVQQQLAENQMNFEQSHENYNLVQKLRLEADSKLKQEKEVFEVKKNEVEEQKKKFFKAQDELSKLTKTLLQIEQYIKQVGGEIQKTKVITNRAEENLVSLEKSKQSQDLLIDTMNEEVKRLGEQKTILTAQLLSQSDETAQAKDILKNAQIEMQKIVASKKNLLERWQKSLMMMQRMDTALQAMKDALTQQKEQNIQIETELSGITQEIRKEAQTSEQLQAKNQLLDNQKKSLQERFKEFQEEQSRLQSQISLLTVSQQTTEGQAKEAEKEKQAIQSEMTQIENNIMKLHTETKKLFEDLVHAKSEHTTIEKTAANLNKQANVMQIEIEEKSVELENLLNEIVRVKIDQLNTQSQIELLETKRNEVKKEKEQNELTVIVYETQIRTGHDLNEKKQHEVGRLNKLHDELLSSQSDTSRNKDEAEKDSLKKSTKELKDANEKMQRDWISKQTELVSKHTQGEQIEENVNNLKTQQTILEQKKSRLNNQYTSYEKEIREIKNALKNLQNDMNKLNDALYENRAKKSKLDNENFNIESEFVEKLKELEKDSVKLEVEIDRLKDEKANLLSEIVECERQILLWERKIQLEKEMQEALDPTVGQSEISELKKEIHRMELRLDDFRKKQEILIAEMARCVDKRETIQLKYQNTGKSGPVPSKAGSTQKSGKDSQAQVHKQISSLKHTLNQTTQSSKQMDGALRKKQQEMDMINGQIEEANDKFTLLESDVNDRSVKLALGKLDKLLNIYQISSLQLQTKRFDALNNKISKLSYPENLLRQRYRDQVEENNIILQSLQKVLNEYPQYTNLISPLLELRPLEQQEGEYEGEQQQEQQEGEEGYEGEQQQEYDQQEMEAQ
ncbi:hypothetical protein PPERSA_11798 [Pseudocohnilembus persalinus]|uniref:Coiled-coil domain-containing protein 40 n=1 Tax=Pseudocohnilembus persalinus TaxID=266149 RepID=A0A0V0QR66_PSEPJ|nr:hypothetical protein PPERSA_11798 [Pseudocohnilembus persalinus]|eukprot:KRX04742.1 hypothetical protein PPERSA_11798 [Pseudocohnilembus persalinus]